MDAAGIRPESESAALRFLAETPLGTRVVVRSRLNADESHSQTDAVGYLRSRTASECAIETKRGLVTIAFTDVTLAKQVPPPPAPRPRAPRPA